MKLRLSFLIFLIIPFFKMLGNNYAPTLIWSTYYSDKDFVQINGITTDHYGSVYIIGETNCTVNFSTNGAYQIIYGGGMSDAFVTKFGKNGTPLWTTFFGGKGNDIGYDIKTDDAGNIYIAGSTSSISGIATNGSYQTKFAGTQPDSIGDGFLAKFDNDGHLLWSTYFGGPENDEIYKIALDKTGNVFALGITQSLNGITTPGVFQANTSGGGSWVFLAKFNHSGAIQWSTYYNGNRNENPINIATDVFGNVFISGQTTSSTGIATSGSFNSTYTGGINTSGFVAKFNNMGQRLWATYSPYSSFITTDLNGNIYISAEVNSTSGIFSKGAYQTLFGGGNYDLNIIKLNGNGSMLWATYYGGRGEELNGGITSDSLDNIYITGYTTSTNNIAIPGAYSDTLNGNKDAFIVKFDSTGNRTWGTYFGGKKDDIPAGISVNNNAEIYIEGQAYSNNGISYFGFQNTYFPGKFGDGFIAKFGIKPNNDAGIYMFPGLPKNYCRDSLTVWAKLKNYGYNFLDSVQIKWTVDNIRQKDFYWKGYLAPGDSVNVFLGNYLFKQSNALVKAWTLNPNGLLDSFPENDTANLALSQAIPSATAGPDTTLCFNQTYTMQGSGGITYKWTPAKYLSNDTIPNPKAVLPNTQLYNLKVRNQQGCSDSAQVLIKVRPKLKVSVAANRNSICLGEPVILTAAPQGGDSQNYIFTWPSDSFSGNPLIINPKISGWHKVVLSDNCTPLSAEDSIYVSVTPKPKASFTWQPKQYIIQKRPVYFNNKSQNASSYLWSFGTKNDSSNGESPTYIFNDTGNYKVTLIAFGNNGCGNDTAIGYINVIDGTVAIYIPNIFTPNGDGHNDYFGIRGTGIKTYSLTIFNRWGELVYDATENLAGFGNPRGLGTKAWDGNFKGAPAPEGVYIYMITATDIFDEKHYLKGNVTLNR